MAAADKATEEAKVQSKIILQTHDELVFDVHKDEHELMKALVKKAILIGIHS